MGHALNPGAAFTGVLERAQDVVGDRAHMTMRTPRGHDHAIGDGGLVGQIDGDNVLGLVVVQPGQNQVFQTGGARAVYVGLRG